MSESSGPKSKDTGSKIQWFEIGKDGDINPAFPNDSEPLMPSTIENTGTFKRLEPTFDSTIQRQPSAPVPDVPEVAEVPAPVAVVVPETPAPVAVVPDASNLPSDQADVLKNYITLKESEVKDLRDQIRQYQTSLNKSNADLQKQSQRAREVLSELETTRRSTENIKRDFHEIKSKHQDELALVKTDYDEKLRLAGNVEAQSEEFAKRREEWEEKIREDLKRIKLKERELENKYELFKRDMQALLDSKDKHLLELKKKNDALDLELESLEDRLRSANTILANMDSKKKRLIDTLRLSISLLETIDSLDVKPERSGKPSKAG